MDADPGLVLARWVFYGAAMVLFGSSLFPFYALRTRPAALDCRLPRPVNVTLAITVLLAAGLWLIFTAQALGDPADLAGTLRVLLLESGLGMVWLVRLGAAALLLLAVFSASDLAVASAGAVLLGCEGWSGHAAAWSLAGSIGQALHVICSAAWVGGLVPLLRLVTFTEAWGQPGGAREPLMRFSTAGMIFVAVIIGTGALNTWRIAPTMDTVSAYNRVLALKVGLVILMVAAATLNRFHVLKHPARDMSGWGALPASIVAEQVLAAAVLLAVSALGLFNPYA